MKGLRFLIVIVFIVLISFSCVRFFSKGYTITYKLKDKNDVEIKEVYTRNVKNERDNYYVEIKADKTTFSYQFFSEFENRKIVTDIIHYKGEYECLLPIIENQTITDIVCYKDHRYYDYLYIEGDEKELDDFVNSLDVKIYNKEAYQDKLGTTVEEKGVVVYTDNILQDYRVGITNLRGIYTIDRRIETLTVFDKDIYSRPLSAIVGKYYITADYTESQQFRTFYFVNLTNGKTKTHKAPKYISFDSYIQGIVDDKLYLYDRDNEKQYEINVNGKIEEVGNNKQDIKYRMNGAWTTISTTKANKILLFSENIEEPEFKNFEYIYRYGNELSGYYFLFEKQKDGYKVYRAPVQNKKAIKYLFAVEDPKDILVIDEYVYFRIADTIGYYSDTTGLRILIKYDELEFNENLIYGVYK